MDSKEIQSRLEIIKLAAAIGDSDTIVLQTSHLKALNSKKIDEILLLLDTKNYRQAIYLIKSFLVDSEMIDSDIINNFDDDNEKVLGIEDMLRMSPLAKETIREYKSSGYTQDDLEAFAKNIETPMANEYEAVNKVKPTYEETFTEIQEQQPVNPEPVPLKEIKTEGETLEFDNAIESANQDTPLDEISAEVLNAKEKPKRTKVLSKYKTLRSKFAKKEKIDEPKKPIKSKKESTVAKSVISKAKDLTSKLKIPSAKKDNSNENSKVVEKVENLENKESLKNIKSEQAEPIKKDIVEKIDRVEKSEKVEKEEVKTETVKKDTVKKVNYDEIYPPIPHIEQKFRQAFVLYPPNKDSEVWIEEVIKFLKNIASNSYTDTDVRKFLDEYNFYVEKGDMARAAQVLLLAAASDSKYAQFILAREMFNGRVLKRDLKKSYTVMKFLASKHYPDAICDLAQFYEYGIGVSKDKKTAVKLYEKAFELGVDRATKHIDRIKESSGILSSFFK